MIEYLLFAVSSALVLLAIVILIRFRPEGLFSTRVRS